MGIFGKKKINSEEEIGTEVSINEEEELEESTEEKVEETEEQPEEEKDIDSENREDIEALIAEMIERESSGGVKEIETREQFIAYAIESTINNFTSKNPNLLNMYDSNKIELPQVKDHITVWISKNISNPKFGKLTKEEIPVVYDGFAKFIWGYDIIEPLIDDNDISDIDILAYDNIRVKIKGKRQTSDITFRTKESYERFVEHVALKNRQPLSDLDAIRSFVDSKTSPKFRLRFNISTDRVSSIGTPYLSIRKIPKFKYGFDYLIKNGMITRGQLDYIVKRLKEGHGLIICGHGGAGKTILLNELIEVLPENSRYDCIQDNNELFSINHKDIMFHSTLEPKGESKVNYNLAVLAKNGLVEDLDGFIIGEMKSNEAAYLGTLAYTGHQCICTTHAESSLDAHYRIADEAFIATGEPVGKFLNKIKSMDTIIFLSHFKVKEIAEVKGYNRRTEDLDIQIVDIK